MGLPNEEEWFKEVTIEALPPTYRQAAELIGIENALKLNDLWGGLQIYFHKLDALLQQQRDALIRKDRAAGMGYQQLALKYKLTEVWIRQIVDHQKDPGQLSMFD